MATWKKLVIASGSSAQYIKGDGTFANFPSFVSAETNSFLGDGGTLLTAPGTNRLIYTGQISNGTSGLFSATDNANSVITFNRHSGNYDSQLGFSSNGNIYYRKFQNTAINTSQAWQQVYHSGNFTNNSANWDSAYTYSQTNRLPLTGGTLSGNLTINADIYTSGHIRPTDGVLTIFNNTSGSWGTINSLGANFGDWYRQPSYGEILVGAYNFVVRKGDSSSTSNILHINQSGDTTLSGILNVPEYIKHVGNTSNYLRFQSNQLDIANTTTKFVNSEILMANDYAIKWNSNNTRIYAHEGNNQMRFDVNGTAEVLKLQGTGIATIRGSDNNDAVLHLNADRGDNNADHWRISSTTDNFLRIATRDSGSYDTKFEIGASTGNVRITNELKVQSGLAVNNASLGSHKFVVDNGTSSFNRGNSAGNILDVRGQNASQMKVTTTAFTVTPSSTFASSVTSNGSIIRRANALTNNGIAMLTTDSNHGAIRLYNSTGTLKTQLSSGTNSYILESNLGIGNSSPASALTIDVADGQNKKALHITQNDAGEWTSKMDTSGYGLLVRSTATNTTPVIQIQGNGTSNNILYGLANGQVSIGSSSPHVNARLYVKNPSGHSMTYISSATNHDTNIVFEENNTAKWMIGHDSSDAGKFKISNGNGFASGTKLALEASGELTLTSTSHTIELATQTGGAYGIRTASVAKFGGYYFNSTSGSLYKNDGTQFLSFGSDKKATVHGHISFLSTGTSTPVNRYLMANNTDTGTGSITIQAGAGSAGYGGGLKLYSHSHATYGGWVTAGISASSGGKFSVNTHGTGGGTNVFTVDASGNTVAGPSLQLNNSGKLQFAGTDTYILGSAQYDYIQITPNSATSYRFNQTGLGVGYSDPQARLQIDTPDSTEALRISSDGSAWFSLYKGQAGLGGMLELKTESGASNVSLQSSSVFNSYINAQGGKLGIGTTGFTGSSRDLDAKLDVMGGINVEGYKKINFDGNGYSVHGFHKLNSITIDGSAVPMLYSFAYYGHRVQNQAGAIVDFGYKNTSTRTLFYGDVNISKTESSAGERISALKITRGWSSGSSTDRLTAIDFIDNNSVQAGIVANRYASHASYASSLEFYVNNGSSSMTPATALANPILTLNGTLSTFAGEVRIQKDDGRFIIQRTSTTHQAEMWMSGTQAYFGSTNGTTVNIKTNNQNAIIINTAQQITFAKNITVGTGQILTPSGINLALNPNTGTVSIGGVINATGTGTNQFAGNVELDHSKLIKFTGDSTTPTIGGDGSHLQFNSYSGIDNSVAVDSAQFTYHSNQAGTTTIIYGGGGLLTKGDVNIEPAGGAAGLWLKSTNSHANIRLINNNGATNTIDEWKIQSNTNHDLKFYNANSEKVTFSSDGDATFAGDLDASSGQSLTGWHTQDKIWVMPSDFMPSTGRNEYNIAMVDNGGEAKTMHGAVSGYVNIPIPSGYKVTHYRLNGTASVEIKAYYSDCTTATATSVMPAPRYTNTEYATNPSSGVEANDTTGRYMILRWNCTSTSHRLYGGYVKIAKI